MSIKIGDIVIVSEYDRAEPMAMAMVTGFDRDPTYFCEIHYLARRVIESRKQKSFMVLKKDVRLVSDFGVELSLDVNDDNDIYIKCAQVRNSAVKYSDNVNRKWNKGSYACVLLYRELQLIIKHTAMRCPVGGVI